MVMFSCASGVEIFNHKIQKQSSHLSFTFSELPTPSSTWGGGRGEKAPQKRESRVAYDLHAWDPDFHVWNPSGLSPDR